MGLRDAANYVANKKAESDWNSGDPEKQKKAIRTWMGLVGIGEGSTEALDSLHELTNRGDKRASDALKHAYRMQAEKAAKKEDVELAQFMVVEANNGWDEAERAIDKTLSEKGARKGKEKEIRNYVVYAKAGYEPAVRLLTELGIDF